MRVQIVLAACLLAAAAPQSPVKVAAAWARATAPRQGEGAVYLTLTAPSGDRLVGAASPEAGMAMLHQSSTSGGISQMRDVEALDLPAGKPVALAPRGIHIMLMDLPHPLVAGSTLPLTLTFAHAAPVTLIVPILPIGSSGPPR